MAKNVYLVSLSALLLVACGSEPADEPVTLEQSELYGRVPDPFDSLEVCERARTESGKWLINCRESLTLCSSGDMMRVVTDIVTEGRYEIDGDRFHLTIEGWLGGDHKLVLERAADGTLREPEYKNPWTPVVMSAEEQQSLDEDCADISR